MRRITGWLFDLYPSAEGITLWIVDDDGASSTGARTPFTPSFFMHVHGVRCGDAWPHSPRSLPVNVTFDWDRQREIYTNEEWNVLRVTRARHARHLKDVVRRLERHFPHYVFFNSDIPSQQLFLYDTGLFPLALRRVRRSTQDGRLAGWTLARQPRTPWNTRCRRSRR